MKKIIFLIALLSSTLLGNAQTCEFLSGKFEHQGKKVQESKWRKVLKTSINENYTIKAAKLGQKRLISLNIAVVPKFTVFQENRLAINLSNGKKIGLKPIKDFKSIKSAANGRERVKVYYEITPEHFKLLSNVKMKSIRVDMGPRYTDITIKATDQEQLVKLFKCLK